MNVASDDLKDLIKEIKTRIKRNDLEISNIKDPKYLCEALEELDNIVGMKRVKDAIARQTMTLMNEINMQTKNKTMLNTILYGPPGVGKSQIGQILGKIWSSLGYLKSSTNYKDKDDIFGIPSFWVILYIIFLVLIGYCSVIMSGVSYIYTSFGLWGILITFSLVLFLLLFLYWYISHLSFSSIDNKFDKDIKDNKDGQSDNIVQVVTRQDFVGAYSGHTALKTKKLLNENRGKVLFIDEAYSLCYDDRDSFGQEALTTLNLFLSQHPDEIVVILAGYKEQMCNGIFKYQPGLTSRCIWHFECEPYSGSDLFEIFKSQVTHAGWSLADSESISNCIESSSSLLSAYGRDTERLFFYSKLAHTRNNFIHHHTPSNILTLDDVRQGLDELTKNNLQLSHHQSSTPKQSPVQATTVLNQLFQECQKKFPDVNLLDESQESQTSEL